MSYAGSDRTRGRSRRSSREHPDAKVLLLSMQDDPRYVREAFAAGATGYVLKEAADTEVVAAIREVAAGRALREPRAGRAPACRGDGGREARRGGPALGPRARGAETARARAHEPGDRRAALHLGAHRRDAPRAHHAEAAPPEPRRARPLTRSIRSCSKTDSGRRRNGGSPHDQNGSARLTKDSERDASHHRAHDRSVPA